MKKNKMKMAALFLAAATSMAMAGCGAKEPPAPTETTTVSSETTTPAETEKPSETTAPAKSEASAGNEKPAAEGPMVLDYEAEPEAFAGNWVLVNAYTSADGILEAAPEACYLEIETNIDTNKLVDEAAYIHADATNLKGTMSFKHADISVDDYNCSGNWNDWTVVDIKGEGKAYFKGAIKFKVRDDDEGVFFNLLTGVEAEDMELFDVLGLNADGQLILGYSEDHIEKDSSALWEYAYIFEKVTE